MKKNLLKLSLFSALITFFILHANAQRFNADKLDKAKNAISASNAVYFQAFVKGDSSLFINRYAKDCRIMVPNGKALNGHKGAYAFYKFAYDNIKLRNGKFVTTNVYGAGDNYVVEEGAFILMDAEGKAFDDGKYLVVWKKTSDGWKMYRDCFNSNNKKD